ncbi:MAG: protein-ADP-ribose hydrolase [Eggerthellaceae bacterium]|nr:protein-ADP-ribose hydrolase [Eggerthellaceae bacterium]
MDRIAELEALVGMLLEERYGKGTDVAQAAGASPDEARLFEAFRALVNTREPIPAPKGFLPLQDEMLKSKIADAGITHASDLDRVPTDERISLWRGDITTLEADAIVNAANSQMLGCWVPGHYCIDNAIHTFAGIQLRQACAKIMQAQGHDEPTGQAKVTEAFNLPSRMVIHTVGPIANGVVTRQDEELLAQSYVSCLEAAAKAGCSSIAFCCISTGVFGFPQKEAADIAVRTVRKWLDENASSMHVIFNVFTSEDERIYHDIFSA